MRIRNDKIYADDGTTELAVKGTDQTARDSANRLQVVATYSALQALDPVASRNVLTQGNNAAGDGCGQTFTSITPRITADGVGVFNATGNANYSWITEIREVIDFSRLPGVLKNDSSAGAKTANDAAVSAAIARMIASGSGSLWIPAGNWYFSNQINILNGNKIELFGDGEGSTVLRGFATDQHGIRAQMTPRVHLHDFTIQDVASSNPPTTEKHGVRLEGGCDWSIIERVTANNCDDAGINVHYHNGESANVVSAHVVVRDCTASNSPNGAGFEFFHAEKMVASNLRSFGNAQHGIRMNSVVGIELSGCEVYSNGNHGISCQAQPDFWSNWHVARDYRIHSNELRDNPYGLVIFNRVSGLKAWGNRIYRTAAGDNLYGVYFNSGSGGICADNVQIFRNDIEKYSGGVMINPSSYTLENIQIEENNILDSAAATTGDVFGVRFNGNANHRRIYVRRNLIRTAQAKGSPIFTYGIIMATAGSQLYCQHNQIYMNAPNAYLSNSASAVVADPGGATDTNLTGSY